MTNYTITATITKINSDGKIILKGVGKHLYEDSIKKQWNLLEGNANADTLKMLALEQEKDIVLNGNIEISLITMAMLQKKPLKLTVSGDGESEYTITAVEVP